MRRQPTHRQTNLIPPIELEPKPSSGRRAKRGLRNRSLAVGVVGTLALSALSINPLASNLSPIAEASGSSDKVSLFLSEPLVQGSGVTEAAQRENFNALSIGACPSSLSIVSSMTFRKNGTVVSHTDQEVCKVDTWDVDRIYGGAGSESSVPSIGGPGTRYMQIPFYENGTILLESGSLQNERSITFELTGAAKYVGFWWSGGNPGNLVRFYSGDTLIATINSKDVTAKLGTPKTGTVTTRGGSSYVKDEYYGNPVFFTGADADSGIKPTGLAGNSNGFIFTYLNLYVEGSLNVNKIQFAGPGFEFDNLAFSTAEQTPEDTMVPVLEVLYNAGTPQTVITKSSADLLWTPGTAMTLSGSPTTSTVEPRATNSGTPITYLVTDPGTSGCTFNPTTFVISYTAVGNCIIRASSTGTDFYETATVDRTFVVSAAGSNNSGGGSSGSSGSTLAATQSLPVDPCTIPSSELEANKSKAFSGFAINSAVATKKMKRQIKRWVEAHPEKLCVSVTGFTMGPRVLPTDPKLAKDRARAVRAYIKSLRPEASFMPITSRTQRLVGDEVRRAKVSLSF